MLVLSRRVGEILMLGDDIALMLLRINGNQVSFGIEAPKDLVALREELWLRERGKSGLPLSEIYQKVYRKREEIYSLEECDNER